MIISSAKSGLQQTSACLADDCSETTDRTYPEETGTREQESIRRRRGPNRDHVLAELRSIERTVRHVIGRCDQLAARVADVQASSVSIRGTATLQAETRVHVGDSIDEMVTAAHDIGDCAQVVDEHSGAVLAEATLLRGHADRLMRRYLAAPLH